MAKYGELKYGQDKYGATTAPAPIPGPPPAQGGPSGPPPPAHGGSGSGDVLVGIPSLAVALGVNVEPFSAESLDYGYNLITWTSPGNKVDTIRLVRNGTGYPSDENDGVILYTGPVGTNRFEDRGVQEGQEYFYGLFIKLNSADILTPSTLLTPDQGLVPGVGSGAFFPAAIARCIAVQKHGGRDTLLDGLPRIYTSPQSDAVGEIDSNSDLAAFVQIFGFQLDKVKTDLTNMLPFWDGTRVPGPMVAPLARTFGQELEFGLGYRQSRILARDSSYIYSRKGTTSGVNAFAKALTGQGAKTIISPNLLRGDDATLDSSGGSWSAVSNCTVGYTRSLGDTPPEPTTPAIALPGGYTRTTKGALVVTASAPTNAMTIRQAGNALSGWGIPVRAGASYAVRVSARGATPQTVLPGIEWRTSGGDLLSTSTSSSGGVDTAGKPWAEMTYTATAPARAAYANLIVTWSWNNVTQIAAGEIHYLGAAQFERIDVPVPDGSMDLSVNPWQLVSPGGTTMAPDGTTALSGQSLKLQSSASGLDAYAGQSLYVVPGRTYNISAFASAPSITAGANGNRGLYVSDGVATPTAVTGLTYLTTLKVTPPNSGAYFGYGAKATSTTMPAMESATGVTFDVIPFYADFTNSAGDSQWPTTSMQAVYDGGSFNGTTITGGRIPIVFWSTQAESPAAGMPAAAGGQVYTGGGVGFLHAYTYDQIVSGALDAYIDARAAAVKAWGKPIMVSFNPFADTWTGPASNALSVIRYAAVNPVFPGRASFVAAWRYVKARFDAAGAGNVTWVHMLDGDTQYKTSSGEWADFVLDDADYDWVGLNGLIKSPSTTVANRWQSYVNRLDDGELGTAGQTKPILMWWSATYNDRGGIFSQVVSALNSGTLGRVRGLMYDDFAGPIDFIPADKTAFGSLGHDPYFASTPSTRQVTSLLPGGTPNGTYTTIASPISGFAQQIVTITPVSSSLEVRLYSPQGTVYWDNVTVSQTSPSPYSDPSRTDVLLFSDRTNFVTNPNFETSAVGWSKTPTAPSTTLTGYSSSATMARSTAQHYSNTASLQVTPPAGATAKSGATTILSDLTPGQVYTVSAQVLVTAAPLVSIEHDGAPFTVSGATASAVSGTVTPIAGGARAFALTVADPTRLSESCLPQTLGKWSRISCTFVATRTVHTIGLYVTNTSSATAFYLDEVMVEAGPVLNAYFDGNTSPDTDWEGTANLSRSHYTRAKAVKSKRLASRMPEYLPVGIPYAVRLAWPGA